jgi:hypothetical protein
MPFLTAVSGQRGGRPMSGSPGAGGVAAARKLASSAAEGAVAGPRLVTESAAAAFAARAAPDSVAP